MSSSTLVGDPEIIKDLDPRGKRDETSPRHNHRHCDRELAWREAISLGFVFSVMGLPRDFVPRKDESTGFGALTEREGDLLEGV